MTSLPSHTIFETATPKFDVAKVREDFPALKQSIRGKPLIYLDNGASAQKPQAVIDVINHYYINDYANIHRGVHYLSERATEAYEGARDKVRRFINANSSREIVFVRGTTEAINLVAHGYRDFLKEGDEILISAMEHHSNIVPWQMVCERTGAVLKVAPINDAGELLIENVAKLLNTRTKLVSITHMSNALGTIPPVEKIIEMAHAVGAKVFLDGAQAVPHMAVDVQSLDCDFYAFSGHKLYGPTGIGVLYGKFELLQGLPPYQGGGDMIREVTFERTTYADLPNKFEAGTPDIVGAIALGAAIEYIELLGISAIADHEHSLLRYATDALNTIPGLNLIGTAPRKGAILSFVLEDIHPHDIGTILDRYGIAVRAGHHCAQPVMARYNVPATTRASLGLYNDVNDIDTLVAGLQKVKEVFA